jgi:type IV pilus assembly protein PilB
MVLSTLHSGSAPETVTRLINMGLEPFVVASALTGTIAQRLVRRLCPDCREPVDIDKTKLELVRRLCQLAEGEELIFYQGRGCEGCQYTGFLGRIPIAEFLQIDEELRGLILDKARTSEVRNLLLQRGWQTILDDGLRKAMNGVTTFDEVMRSASLREAL